MTEMEFTRIKNQIKELETKSAESKGRMKAIQDEWLSQYGFSDLESAKKKLEELKGDAEAKKQKRDEMMNKLETSFDWNKF